ncbi:MAG: chemotaxis response regulator protein-glutamate methylesterase [Pseudomonadota bacterium]
MSLALKSLRTTKAEPAPIRLLVVDDSLVARTIISGIIARENDMTIVAQARNGREAIQLAGQHEIDVVLLDLEMPEMSGADALPGILRARPGAQVIMVSSTSPHAARAAVQAVSRGAIDFVPKPSTASGGVETFGEYLTSKIRDCRYSIGARRVAAPMPAPTPRPAPSALDRRSPKPPPGYEAAFGAVFIGASTGGPPALTHLVSNLAPSIQVPLFIVQHMPPAFMTTMAAMLARASGLPCTEAAHGQLAEPAHIYLAPGDRHMEVAKGSGGRLEVRLSDAAPENFCRPAVDPLFRTASKALGARALGVILTGMGRDGLEGATAIKKVGGTVLVQDEATSVVWGMPRVVAEAGMADEILPLESIGPRITNRLERRRRRV